MRTGSSLVNSTLKHTSQLFPSSGKTRKTKSECNQSIWETFDGEVCYEVSPVVNYTSCAEEGQFEHFG